MTPTEHEYTVATDAAAKALYLTAGGDDDDSLPWEDVPRLTQNQIRESVLPIVDAALQALPDRRAEGWAVGEKAGEEFERARWQPVAERNMIPLATPERPDNPYGGQS